MGTESEQPGLKIDPLRSFVISDKTAEISINLLDPVRDTDVVFIQQMGEITLFIAPGHEAKQDHGKSQIISNAFYNRSDKLAIAFDEDKYLDASEQARELVGNSRSAQYFEQMLRILYGNPQAELVHIIVGYDKSSGNTYRLFGTINSPKRIQGPSRYIPIEE